MTSSLIPKQQNQRERQTDHSNFFLSHSETVKLVKIIITSKEGVSSDLDIDSTVIARSDELLQGLRKLEMIPTSETVSFLNFSTNENNI